MDVSSFHFKNFPSNNNNYNKQLLTLRNINYKPECLKPTRDEWCCCCCCWRRPENFVAANQWPLGRPRPEQIRSNRGDEETRLLVSQWGLSEKNHHSKSTLCPTTSQPLPLRSFGSAPFSADFGLNCHWSLSDELLH